jgi:hypothetical protein
MLDRLLEEMPRLTDDAELISAATRKLIATMAGYVDRMSEQGVAVYQRERDRRLQWSDLGEARVQGRMGARSP